jgi:hypothetical protein
MATEDGKVVGAPRSVLGPDSGPAEVARALRRLEDYVRALELRIASAELRLRAGSL